VLDQAEAGRAVSVLSAPMPEAKPLQTRAGGGRGGKRSSAAWVKRGQFVPPELWDDAMYQAKKDKLDMSELVTALLTAYLERRVDVKPINR